MLLLSHYRNVDGLSGCKLSVFVEERQLFSYFIETLCKWDPDILLGWDIQGGSIGFLAERAAQLGIRFLDNISRTPSLTTTNDSDDKRKLSNNLLPNPLVADPAQVEEVVIEDEWGRTHASGVHVGGRIVLNAWRLIRGEVKLNMYTIEAVSEAVLRQKIPSIPYKVLTEWFASGPAGARYRCIEYVIRRANLNLEIMSQLDMVCNIFNLIYIVNYVQVVYSTKSSFADKSYVRTCTCFWHRLFLSSLPRFPIQSGIHAFKISTYTKLSCYISRKPTGLFYLLLPSDLYLTFLRLSTSRRALNDGLVNPRFVYRPRSFVLVIASITYALQ